jgi:uncharacterized protein (DUF342 family)
MGNTQYDSGALNKIRENVLLLLIAKEYLCEDVFLTKIGKSIEQNIIKLKDDISSLKKVFPGKLKAEVKIQPVLENLSTTAKSLIEQSEDIKKNCMAGELGRQLTADTKSIADAVNTLRIQILGKAAVYQGKKSFSDIFAGLKDSLMPFWNILMIGAKILSLLIIITVGSFLYLYFTMEKEGPLLESITESRSLVSDRQETISQLESRKMELLEEKKSIEDEVMERRDKVALMDLEMEIQSINQQRDSLEAEIIAHQKKIDANLERIEVINKTPFLERLLRQ